MKVRIVKPLAGSGYFTGEEFTTDPQGLEIARERNIVEVLVETAAVEVVTEKRNVTASRKVKKNK